MKLPVYKERYNIVISTQTSNRLAVAEYILQTKDTVWNVLASTEITVLALYGLYLRIGANPLRLPAFLAKFLLLTTSSQCRRHVGDGLVWNGIVTRSLGFLRDRKPDMGFLRSIIRWPLLGRLRAVDKLEDHAVDPQPTSLLRLQQSDLHLYLLAPLDSIYRAEQAGKAL